MKILILTSTLLIVVNLSNLFAQDRELILCIYESKYFSEGSIVGMQKPDAAVAAWYAYICSKGTWELANNDDHTRRYSALYQDHVNLEEILKARAKVACMYGNMLYGEGSIICQPKVGGTNQGALYSWKCIKGEWVFQNNHPCKPSN